MQLWALIVDGFRESLDRKIFWVLIGLSVLIALTMLSVQFHEDSVSLLFGTVTIGQHGKFSPFTDLGRGNIIGIVVYVLLDGLVGWFGLVLMIIATAGAIPAFIEQGAVDVLLAKPIARSRLFLYKYLSGLVFVFVQATVFVVLTFLVMWLWWGVFAPGYLLGAPLLVLLFSYLYCVSVFVALRTRSAVACALLTIGAWFMFTMFTQGLPAIFDAHPDLKENTSVYNAVRVMSWALPKTGDFTSFAARWAGAGTSVDVFTDGSSSGLPGASPEDLKRAREMEKRELRKNPWLSIGTSLLFEFVVLAWAMRLFARRDF